MESAVSLIRFASLVQAGMAPDRAIELVGGIPSNKNFRYLLEIAIYAGAAAVADLRKIADQLSNQERANQRLQVLVAAPRASARLIIWLPLLVMLLADVSGFGVFQLVLGTPVLQASVIIGFILLLAAGFASRQIVKRATVADSATGVFLLGVAMTLGASGSMEKALALALPHYEAIFGQLPAQAELDALDEFAELSNSIGNPSAELLRQQAELLQREENLLASQKIEKLAIRLLLPLGLMVLPAFVLIALIPLSFSMLGIK